VEPVLDPWGLAEIGLALRPLVLVVGEDEVHAAPVYVQPAPGVAGAHHATLYVPAGPATAPGALPAGLSGLGSFPEGEVVGLLLLPGVFLFLAPGVHAVAAAQPPIAGILVDLEVDAPAGGHVGVTLVYEGLDELDYLVYMVGDPRVLMPRASRLER